MSWAWVWIGGALVLGFFLGATLMSLLVMSRDSESEDGQAPPGPESKNVLYRGRSDAPAGSAVGAGGCPKAFGLKDSIPANDAWEEFSAKTGGVC